MGLYGKYLLIHFKSQMQYRTSFWLLTLGQLLIPFMVFAGMVFLFERFGQLKGWNLHEAALIFGLVHLAIAISECFARGFDAFASLVVRGDFDRLLVRPRGTVLQVLGSNFDFARVGRMLQGAVVLVWALAHVQVAWHAAKVVTLALMIVNGVLIFTGIYMMMAAICFWTIQGLEITHVLTDGGRELAQYPLHIYEKWVTVLFTFLIPFGTFNYWPALYLLDRTDGPAWLYMAMPLAGALFLVPCLLVWRIGVRHYRSTGS